MNIYNKLIRDRIPENIQNDNKSCIVEILDEPRFIAELMKKLIEESMELNEATNRDEIINELADLHEIIDTIKVTHAISDSEVQEKQHKKAQTNGRFEKRLYLVSVSDPDE